MKNNYPIDDEAEALEQALLDLEARKRVIERDIQLIENGEVLLLTIISITLGIYVGLWIA